MIKFLVYSLVMASLLTIQHNEWTVSKDSASLQKLASGRQAVIAFIFDSQSCPLCKLFVERRIADINKQPIMKQYKVLWTYFDYSSESQAMTTLSLSKGMHIRYYKQKNYIDFPEALDLVKKSNTNKFDYEATLARVHKFIADIFATFSKEVTDTREITNILENGEPVIVYIGQKNGNYEKYYEFSSQNMELNAYHSFTPEVIKEIKNLAEVPLNILDDMFMVVRPHYNHSYVKEPKSTYFKFPLNASQMQRLVEFEMYPKLREPSFNELNINLVENKRHMIILYSKSEPYSFVNWMHFKRIVKYMPKNFILSYSSHKHEEHRHYVNLFEKIGVPLKEERIYLIHRLGSPRIQIAQYHDDFNTEKFLEFMIRFLEKHKLFLNMSTESTLVKKLNRSLNKLRSPYEEMDEL